MITIAEEYFLPKEEIGYYFDRDGNHYAFYSHARAGLTNCIFAILHYLLQHYHFLLETAIIIFY